MKNLEDNIEMGTRFLSKKIVINKIESNKYFDAKMIKSN
jgi:hypothetical protein